ncbi:hypothetical protein L596_010034 [Steinernema carpocapsae]|uniref:Cytochrome P450 n=1 Tax=Steinernema carpocapsae TaxID=34508 RepID=A0A4U5PHE5_STECR|nr:hypothetical protein L596_010034 [Steinernema carpocapsae]
MLLLVAGAVIVYYLYTFYYVTRKKLPPGPLPLPGIGNLLTMGEDFSENGNLKVQKWVNEYGKVFTLWMPQPSVLICDKELLKQYFIKQGDAFAGRPSYYINQLIIGGDYGLIFNDNSIYKQQRRFALHVLRDFGMGRPILQDAIHVESRRLVNLFAAVEDIPTDPSAFLTTAVGNIVHKLVFGTVREHDDPFIHDFKRDLQLVLEEMETPFVLAIESLPFLRHLEKVFDLGLTKLWKHNDRIIDKIRSEIESHKKTIDYTNEPRDYMDAFLMEMKRRKEAGEQEEFTEQQLSIAVYDLFSAGTETTVTTLRYGIHYLLNYPEIQDKIYEEIDRVIGLEHRKGSDDGRPSASSLRLRCDSRNPAPREHTPDHPAARGHRRRRYCRLPYPEGDHRSAAVPGRPRIRGGVGQPYRIPSRTFPDSGRRLLEGRPRDALLPRQTRLFGRKRRQDGALHVLCHALAAL